MRAGTIPDRNYWGVRKDLAGSYRREAENVERTDSMTPAEQTAKGEERVALNEQSIKETQKVLADWNLSPGSDKQANEIAWALQDMGWALLDSGYSLGWGEGYTATDRTKIDGYKASMDSLQTSLNSTAWKDVDEGKPRANFDRITGLFYREYGYWMGLDGLARDGYFDLALGFFNKVLATDSPADNDAYGDSLQTAAQIYFEKARISELATETRVADFKKAHTMTENLIVNPRLNVNRVAKGLINLGWAYHDLNGLNSVDPYQLGGLGITGLNADGQHPDDWKTVVQFYVQAIADHSGNYSQISEGWIYKEAWKLMNIIDPTGYPIDPSPTAG
jgi:hypothetical protein